MKRMKLARVQCTVPEDMHKKMCCLADKQAIGMSVLYRNIMAQWYEDKFVETYNFWAEFGNEEESQ